MNYLIANPNVVLHLHIHCVDDYERYIKSRLRDIKGNINLYFHKYCDYTYVEDLFEDVDIIALIQNEYYGDLAKTFIGFLYDIIFHFLVLLSMTNHCGLVRSVLASKHHALNAPLETESLSLTMAPMGLVL